MEPPVKVTVELPVVAAIVPPQVSDAVLSATNMPLGNVSTNGVVKVAAVSLVLDRVMVSAETPPALISAGLKALLMVGVGAGAVTVRVATAGLELLPLLVSRAPTPIELV